MDKIPVHVMGLAHVPVRRDSTRCAYTMKVFNLCKMLRALGGYHVTLYGLAGSDASVADEFVEVVSQDTWRRVYGNHDMAQYQFDWSQEDACWQELQRRSAFEIPRHMCSCDADKPELVLCSFGYAHQPATERLPSNAAVIESGIGYSGSFADFRVFESFAIYHTTLGRMHNDTVPMGKSYWTVIPNYFDPDEFDFAPKKDDYLLYLGRLNHDKGFEIGLAAAKRAGMKMICVGQLPNPPDGDEAKRVVETIRAHGALYVPAVGPDERRGLLARARAVFVPSQYVEPFGGVHIEANASGTPVITSDWGVFPETVLQGVTGFRCKTLGEYVWAARHVAEIDPQDCRDWAMANFSLDAVAPRYDAYLSKIRSLCSGRGWDMWPTDENDPGEIMAAQRVYPSGVTRGRGQSTPAARALAG